MRRLSETRVEGAREALVRWHARRDRRHRAATSGTEPEDRSDGSFGSGPVMPNRPRNHDLKVEEAARKRLLERLVRQWEDIRRLYLAGADLRRISKRLGISARTVYRYKDLAEPPPRSAYKRKRSVLDPYVPYSVSRWNEGCRNGKKLALPRDPREGLPKQRRDLRPLHRPAQARRSPG